ncbi:hypothetical protein WJX84_007986 [Apatococcus fuscideae]|uniref:RCK N-terminal domain-containing protein n=1 Tax=Apatococcus fuscideae TaxID=2026836 RepID=A0AAW1SZ84_9CHLO
MMTQLAGLSLALGAFLAGLLLAETEFALQVESDIAPYKGLLMGLFFMTVGMEISVGLFFAKWQTVLLGITILIVGKTAVMAAIGGAFGLSKLQSVRAGLLLAAGGEFAFVTFQEAIVHGILPADMVRQLFLVVALSMAATPFLADFGQRLGKMFEKGDMKAMQPDEGASKEMRDHVIIAGFGRVGQIIGQLLSERLIPFVALDVQAERVQAGQELDLPVYFGDAGSGAVLHSVGAHRAACAVITLDTPGANYRTVWALHKNFPNVKIYVRAHDVHHGLNLEKAGATAVVPETLEPSLQLAAAVLSQLNMPQDEVTAAIQQFRRDHISELQVLSNNSGSSLGYGFGGSLAVKEKDIGEEGNGKRSAAYALYFSVPGPITFSDSRRQSSDHVFLLYGQGNSSKQLLRDRADPAQLQLARESFINALTSALEVASRDKDLTPPSEVNTPTAGSSGPSSPTSRTLSLQRSLSGDNSDDASSGDESEGHHSRHGSTHDSCGSWNLPAASANKAQKGFVVVQVPSVPAMAEIHTESETVPETLSNQPAEVSEPNEATRLLRVRTAFESFKHKRAELKDLEDASPMEVRDAAEEVAWAKQAMQVSKQLQAQLPSTGLTGPMRDELAHATAELEAEAIHTLSESDSDDDLSSPRALSDVESPRGVMTLSAEEQAKIEATLAGRQSGNEAQVQAAFTDSILGTMEILPSSPLSPWTPTDEHTPLSDVLRCPKCQPRTGLASAHSLSAQKPPRHPGRAYRAASLQRLRVAATC